MQRQNILILLILVIVFPSFAQVSISSDENPPDPSAMLDVRSTFGGVLMPRMTTAERDAIVAPADALMIFNITTRCFESYNAMAGIWEQVHCFTCPLPEAAGVITGPSGVCDNSVGVVFSVPPVAGATGYTWNYSGTGFSITEGDNTNTITASFTAATAGTLTVTGINNCGPGPWSPPLLLAIDQIPPATPVAQTPVISQSYISWQWNAVPEAAGYRWNTVDDYATSVDLGSVTSYSQIFLSCGTPYTIYIWAYNYCGNSAPLPMTATTYACCGLPMTVTHMVLAGGGAPVNKTVTYETVSYSAGGADKCWIARNLGAGSQASAWNDASESAAGWYYQFNRKQGYKHDGVNRTPNTAWINLISENSQWEAANDPCVNSFGANSGWRLPTSTEWASITDAYATILDDFDGPLKIHTGGYLNFNNGNLELRGQVGTFWSATQLIDDTGVSPTFHLNATYLDVSSKSQGTPVRCIRNF
jgi:hypothetical protein